MYSEYHNPISIVRIHPHPKSPPENDLNHQSSQRIKKMIYLIVIDIKINISNIHNNSHSHWVMRKGEVEIDQKTNLIKMEFKSFLTRDNVVLLLLI